MHGVLLIDKSRGVTSHDVVARVRRIAGTRRVGHAGTLDPLATGLLVCCIGRATRVVPWLVGLRKEYTGEMALGAASDTYDAEGTVTPVGDPPAQLDLDALREHFRAFTGMIEQAAPPYSAVKVRGRKLYEYARAGEPVPVKRRAAWVERFEPVRYFPPRVAFAARVGSGVYIRSLVHEVGQRIGCGAYLTALCRTRVGAFAVENAATVEWLDENRDALPAALLSIAEALAHLPKLYLLPAAEARLRNGVAFALADVSQCEGLAPAGRPALVVSSAGAALAVVETAAADSAFRPLCVLSSEGD
jgi:tRNA pseudouridine55 synthase